MSVKLGYTADEWEVLRKLPLDAAMCVVFSGETGPFQLMREAKALSDAIRAATRSTSSLVAAIAEELSRGRNVLAITGSGDEDILPEETRRRARADALEGARLAGGILAEKTTRSDAEAYKRWVLDLARAVAGAAKEGGFLGLGGTRVTAEEQAAVDALAAALGIGS